MAGALKKLAMGVSLPILKSIATSDWGWRFVHHPLSRCVAYMQKYRTDMRFPSSVLEDEQRIERELEQDLVVRRGPFAGLRYPSMARLGSECLPKLLGVYEQELHPVFMSITDRPYTQIINVGCAEGYYSVGLAVRYPSARVLAYDIDARQTAFCNELAAINGVSERVETRSACTPEELASFPFSGRGLIVCDCEGYESELFTKSAVANLETCDVIVELHDHIDLTITEKILGEFQPTHNVLMIPAIDTVKRAKTFEVPELAGVDLEVRRRVLTERFAVQEWAFFEARRFV